MNWWIISISVAILFIGWIVYEAWTAPEVDENGIKIKKERKDTK